MADSPEIPTGVKLISAVLFLGGFTALLLSVGLHAYPIPVMFVAVLLGIASFVAGAKLLQADSKGWKMAQTIFVISFLLDAWMMRLGQIPIVRMLLTFLMIYYLYTRKDIFFEE